MTERRRAAHHINIVALFVLFISRTAVGDNGWTNFNNDLVDGQKIVYVAENGSSQGTVYTWVEGTPNPNNDEISGDPTVPGFAVDTFDTATNAFAELTNGEAGWVLLRRGDKWEDTQDGLLIIDKSGPSGPGWLLIGAYEDCDPPCNDRPVINRIKMDGGTWSFSKVAFVSLHIRGSGTERAIRVVKDGFRLHIEDVFVPPGPHDGISIEDDGGGIADVRVRRCVIYGRHKPSDKAQGLFVNDVDGLLIEESVFWHNGWIPDTCPWPGKCPDAEAANDTSQNVYLNCSNSADTVFRNNITADASSHGCQQRRGGLNENNLYLRNAVALLWGPTGSTSESCQWPTAFAFGTIRDNVVIEGRDIGQTGHGWGIRMQKVGLEQEYKPTLVTGNLLAHQRNGTSVQGISIDSAALDIEVTRNVVYDWTSSSGLPAALKIWCHSNPQENIYIHENEIQQVNGGELVWNQPSFGEFSYSENVYYPTAGSCQFRFSDIGPTDPCPSGMGSGFCEDFQEWVATAESDAVAQQVNYTDPSRDIESYMVSIGADQDPSYDPNDPITSFMLRAIEQRKGNWDEDFTAARVNCYMRAGFDMAEP